MTFQDYVCKVTLLCEGRDVLAVQEQLRHALSCLFDEPCILEMHVTVPVAVPAGSNLEAIKRECNGPRDCEGTKEGCDNCD